MSTVIFPDRNISPAHFKDAPEHSLLVRTIFHTIQGEGPFAGHPAVFLRLGGCNLGAKGVEAAGCEFCDTDFRIEKSGWMHFRDIVAAMETYPFPNKQPLLVITGGEPALQQNLVAFCDMLITFGWTVQIETNGMYELVDLHEDVTLVVSPKLGAARTYPKLKEEVLTRADCLKFVVEADPSSPYHTVPDYAIERFREFDANVFVSPIAVYRRPMTEQEGERASAWDGSLIDRPATAANYRYAAEYALANGFRISIQMHLFLAMP